MQIKTPPMGFNTWNTFGENISDALVRETADAMVALGLKDAGYEYLVIDDCWSKRERDPETGKIVPDPVKFPYGMKALSDYVHEKGLKFGMYSCAGVRTCADYPGSFDHEFLDAETFAEYGCDFLKYDFCYKPSTANGPVLYHRMSMALKSCGRDILFSACNWGSDEVNKWIRSTGAHMYRSTGDINDSWASMRDIAMSQLDNLAYSAPGCYNDIDMLTIGMYGKGNVGSLGCNDTEYKTQFALWCIYSAPLMLGGDIRTMNEGLLKLVTNRDLLRIDQDMEARPAFLATEMSWFPGRIVLVKHLSDNELAVGFFNMTETGGQIPFFLENIGLTASSGRALHMREVFTGEERTVKEFMNPVVEAHDCSVYLCRIVKA